jgi:hypothetical protein
VNHHRDVAEARDDDLEQRADVAVRLEDQDPCHSGILAGRGKERARLRV